jgi:LemA protein
MSLLILFLLIILALLFAACLYFVAVYNRLQSLRNGALATLSQIRVAMKKRLDMIEQLVDSVKSYAHFERDLLERITKMRSSLGSARPGELREIEGLSRGLMGEVTAVAESYPALKTSEAVTLTMRAIEEVEGEISRHRYTYNNIVQEHNTMLDTVPSSFVASISRLKKMEYISFEEDELRRLGYLSAEEEPGRPGVSWE